MFRCDSLILGSFLLSDIMMGEMLGEGDLIPSLFTQSHESVMNMDSHIIQIHFLWTSQAQIASCVPWKWEQWGFVRVLFAAVWHVMLGTWGLLAIQTLFPLLLLGSMQFCEEIIKRNENTMLSNEIAES